MVDRPDDLVSVLIDPDRTSDWTVEPGLFGRFAEHLGGAMYPGVFEDYVKNGSFDVWNTSGSNRSGLVFPDVDRYEGVAYPWEPVGSPEEVHLDQRIGGIRGRSRDDALDAGHEVPKRYSLEPENITRSRYQRITLDGTGGIEQRVVLPDRRTSTYTVAFSIRGRGISEWTVRLDSPTDERNAFSEETVSVDSDWKRFTIELTLDRESRERFDDPRYDDPRYDDPRYDDNRYGAYYVTFVGEGGGTIDVDWVTLVPGDAIEGKFNPTTVELLRELDVTGLRWPGGNYASQYRWRNGVGPISDRPVVPVVNWGGLDPNYLGTNEWLRFCELVEAEPYITVPFWSATGPEEAASWVEYCNGDPDGTEMGELRADHGYPDPWNVSWWAIGNEVWGDWQVGGTDAKRYAEGYEEYKAAMRSVDPGIEIDACGIDPWYTSVHDGSHEKPRAGERPVWNEILFENAGGEIDGVDVHRYTEGISDHTSEPGDRRAWIEENDETPVGYVELLVNDPGCWDSMFEEIRELAAVHGIEEVRMTIGEWGLRSNEVESDWPRAAIHTMAHATFATRALQAFIRNGQDVEFAHWTDFSLYARPGSTDVRSPHPGAQIFRNVADAVLEGDERWRRIETEIDGSPTRTRPETGVSILEAEDVELVDAVTIGTKTDSTVRSKTLIVNGSLTEPVDVEVTYDDHVDTVDLRCSVVLGAIRSDDSKAKAATTASTSKNSRQPLLMKIRSTFRFSRLRSPSSPGTRPRHPVDVSFDRYHGHDS